MSIVVRSLPVLALGLIVANPAAAVAPVIHDEGKVFGPEAIKKADAQIHEIYAKYHKDLLIETFPTVPADMVEKFKAMDSRQRSEYLRKVAIDRAKQQVVSGIYVLVVKEPLEVYIAISPDARKAFDQEFYSRLYEALVPALKGNRADGGLAAALKLIEERLGGSGSR